MEKINLSERSCKMQPLGEILTGLVGKLSMDDNRIPQDQQKVESFSRKESSGEE